MQITVIRNQKQYGPYDEHALLSYVNQGKLLLHDKAIAQGAAQQQTIGFYLRMAKLKVNRQHKGNILQQIKDIGTELLFPRTKIFTRQFVSDPRFLILALVGFLPMVFMHLPLTNFLVFYAVSLYFSTIWGLFFYYCFKTRQVELKTTLTTFFLTQAFVFLIWGIGLPLLNPFYRLLDAPFPIDALGYVFGVGVCEELAKALPLLIILHRAKEPLVPQTMVFYGLMSGIAFGVWEGVEYQMGLNAQADYTTAFFLNILRLTSLPFLHACWCGIAGYFLSFAHLYPKYRRGLYVLALAIPALIHGLYDTFANFPIVPLGIVIISLMLLVVYLKQSVNFQSKLSQ